MRRKVIGILLIILILLTFVACSSQPNMVTVAELTEREELILSTTTDQYFVYDFYSEDKGSKELSIWMEKYEAGKQVGEKQNHTSAQVNQEGTIMITMQDHKETQQKSTHLVIQDQSGTSMVSFNDTIAEIEFAASLSGNLQDELQINDEEVVLGYVAYTMASSISGLTLDFYGDPQSNMKELEKYDLVYLIKAQFQ